MSENPVCTEVAEAEFERFCKSFDLEVDATDIDKDDADKFAASKKVFVRAVERGRLVVDETGCPVYTPARGEGGPIKFKRWTGATLMAAQGAKDGHNVTKLHLMMADITGRDAKTFAQLDGQDYRVVTTVFSFFFAQA